MERKEIDIINYKLSKYKTKLLKNSSNQNELYYISKINYYTKKLDDVQNAGAKITLNNLKMKFKHMELLMCKGEINKSRLEHIYECTNYLHAQYKNDIQKITAPLKKDMKERVKELTNIILDENNEKHQETIQIADKLIDKVNLQSRDKTEKNDKNRINAILYDEGYLKLENKDIEQVNLMYKTIDDIKIFNEMIQYISNNKFIKDLKSLQEKKSLKNFCKSLFTINKDTKSSFWSYLKSLFY
jgi:hypothetical protein